MALKRERDLSTGTERKLHNKEHFSLKKRDVHLGGHVFVSQWNTVFLWNPCLDLIYNFKKIDKITFSYYKQIFQSFLVSALDIRNSS